jgi:hypothetical protein
VTARSFALVFGILYLGAGLLGLMPGMLAPAPANAPPLGFDVMHGVVLGLFTVNMLHTLVHLAIGAWGLWAFMGHASPTFFARSLAVFYGVLGMMGLIPGLNTVFGLIPLHGHDVWLHLGTAAIAAYVGWRHEAGERRSLDRDRRKAARVPVDEERREALNDRRQVPLPS